MRSLEGPCDVRLPAEMYQAPRSPLPMWTCPPRARRRCSRIAAGAPDDRTEEPCRRGPLMTTNQIHIEDTLTASGRRHESTERGHAGPGCPLTLRWVRVRGALVAEWTTTEVSGSADAA